MKNLENYRRKCRGTDDTYFQFDHFKDLIDIVEENSGERRTVRYMDCGAEAIESGGIGSWSGSNSMSEAIDLARHGWEYGIERLNAKIKISSQNEQYKSVYDVAGGHVSVPRYLNGYPTSMIRRVPTENKDKVITIVKIASVLGDVSADKMIDNGSKFVQIIQNLESHGYRCNVDLIFASSKRFQSFSGGAHVVRLRVKNANERLNPAKMCFPLVHPSMFRRFIFKLREIDPILDKNGWHSAGCSFFGNGRKEDEKRGIEMIERYLNKNDYFIPYTINDPATFKLEEFKFNK